MHKFDEEVNYPKLSGLASIAYNIFNQLQRDRVYVGTYSLPTLLSNDVIDKGIEKLNTRYLSEDIEKIVKAIDNNYVNNIISEHNKKVKESRS